MPRAAKPAKKAARKAAAKKAAKTPAARSQAKPAAKRAKKTAAPAASKAPRKAAAPKEPAGPKRPAGPTKQAETKGAVGPAEPAGPKDSAGPRVSAAPPPPAAPKPAKRAAAPKAPRAPVEKRRVVFAKDLYEARKDELKAPFKAHGLKWQFLGEGKGRYHKDGVNVFAQFLDNGVHYSVWGDDRATVDAICDGWRRLLGEAAWAAATAQGRQAVAAEQAQQESEALRAWRLQEPQRRAGEPDFFFQKRTQEWLAKKPA